jgi:hypothetical protein
MAFRYGSIVVAAETRSELPMRYRGFMYFAGTVLVALLAVWGLRFWYQSQEINVIRPKVPQTPQSQPHR